MSAFWYNFFSNGWVSSGLLIALPIFVLICLTVASILLEHSGEHGKWQEERDNVFKEYKLAVDYHDKREAKRLHQQYRALKKTEPPLMSFRGWILFWLIVSVAIFLLVLGVVSEQYRDTVYANYINMDSSYVIKKSPKIENYALLKDNDNTMTDQIKRQVKDVSQADEILLKFDNGKTITMPGPQGVNDLSHGKTVIYKQRLVNNKKDSKKLSMKLIVATPKEKYKNYHGFKTSYHLVVTQNFSK